MDTIIKVMTDEIHILTIIIATYCFFCKDITNEKVKYIWTAVITGVVSFLLSVFDIGIVGLLVYLFTVFMVLSINFYSDKKVLLPLSVWLVFMFSMLDSMAVNLVDIVGAILKIDLKFYRLFIASVVVLILVYFGGKVYFKKYSYEIKNFGIGKIIFLSILTIANTYVTSIVAVIINENFVKKNFLTYAVMFIIVIIGVFLQLGAVILLSASRDVSVQKKALAEKYLDEQKRYYEYLEMKERETKKFRHDLRNHMEVLDSLTRNGKYDECKEYLEQINEKIEGFGNSISVSNGIADAIINKYYAEACEKNVHMTVSGIIPTNIKIESIDICIILSNMLSNAIEAAEKCEKGFVGLECKYNSKSLILAVKNTYTSTMKVSEGRIKTTKSNPMEHGFGIINIEESVNKYNGIFNIELVEELFSATVLLMTDDD